MSGNNNNDKSINIYDNNVNDTSTIIHYENDHDNDKYFACILV